MSSQKVVCSLSGRLVGYGIQTFSFCMLHSIFSAFYVDFFLRCKLFTYVQKENTNEQYISGLKSAMLWHLVIGQAGYAVWSSLSDVGLSCFSYVQLKTDSSLQLSRLSLCGPLWALIFALLWFPTKLPYVYPGLNYMFLMIMYDKLYLYCLETCQMMLYGNRKRTVERERRNIAIMFFRMLGSSGVGLASCLYDGTNKINWLGTFRTYNSICALAAGLCFYALSRSQNEIDLSSDVDIVKNSNDGQPQKSNKFFTFAFQTLRRNSMKAVAILYALQGYSSALSTNFLCLFLMVVCARKPSSPLSSLLQALSFVVPYALSSLIIRLYGRYGKKNTVSVILFLRWIMGCLLLLLSMQMMRDARGDGGIDTRSRNRVDQRAAPTTTIHGYGITFATLFFTYRVLTEITTDLYSAVLADVTDEDTVIFGRNDPMSTAIQRLTSIPTKLFHSLAIIITCIYLNTFDAIPIDVPFVSGSSKKDINIAAKLVWFIGCNILLVSTLMLAVWIKWYDLSDKYLTFVQTAMRKRVERGIIGVV